MRRDMELARQILMEVEASSDDPRGSINIEIESHSAQEVAYHVMLLGEAGLLEVRDLCTMGPDGFNYKPKRLTWTGHEFLDAARDETIWSKAKKQLMDTTGGLAFDLLKAVLIETARKQLGLDS